MVSYLALFAGLTIHQAAATSLFTFLFTGILGTWLYQRRGSIDWRITIPVCASRPSLRLRRRRGCGDHRPPAARHHHRPHHHRWPGFTFFFPNIPLHRPATAAAAVSGCCSVSSAGFSGFGSGFSGAGGPLFSVPLMVILRYAPLTAVATSQVLQIVAATSGSIENFRHGFIDWNTAAVVTVFELLGVIVGVRLAHIASAFALRRLAGALCVITGGLLLVRTL